MIIYMQCSVSTGYHGSAVNEEIEVEVPEDFWEKAQSEQYEYLQSAFDDWLGSNSDSGFSFSHSPEADND